jgi:hypothetical protein
VASVTTGSPRCTSPRRCLTRRQLVTRLALAESLRTSAGTRQRAAGGHHQVAHWQALCDQIVLARSRVRPVSVAMLARDRGMVRWFSCRTRMIRQLGFPSSMPTGCCCVAATGTKPNRWSFSRLSWLVCRCRFSHLEKSSGGSRWRDWLSCRSK